MIPFHERGTMTHLRKSRSLVALVALIAAAAILTLGPWLVARADTPAEQRLTIVDLPVTGNAAVATTALTSVRDTTPHALAYRITVLIKSGASDSVLDVSVTRNSVTHTGSLNSGTALTAGQWYTFTVGAASYAYYSKGAANNTQLSWNFAFETSTTVDYMDVQEVSIP